MLINDVSVLSRGVCAQLSRASAVNLGRVEYAVKRRDYSVKSIDRRSMPLHG